MCLLVRLSHTFESEMERGKEDLEEFLTQPLHFISAQRAEDLTAGFLITEEEKTQFMKQLNTL